MPELPDVEAFRLLVEETCLERRIEALQLRDASMLREVEPQELESALVGRTVLATRRHGKYLFLGFDAGPWLELHFGMSGFLRFLSAEAVPTAHERLALHLEGASRLAFDCQRKLGEIGLAESPERFIRDKGLGADPYADGLDAEGLVARLASKRGTVKAALMDQSLLAGLGNVYADEVLLAAGLHPKTKVQLLDRREVVRMAEATKRVLEAAVQRRADPERMPDFLLSQRSPSGRCPRCGGPVEKLTVSGRSAWFCPRCQR